MDRTPLFVCSVTDGGAMVRPWQGNLHERPSNPTDPRTATLLQCHQELACPPGSGPERGSRSVMSLLNRAPSECRGHLAWPAHSPAHTAKPSRRFPTASKRFPRFSGRRLNSALAARVQKPAIYPQPRHSGVMASGRQPRSSAHEQPKSESTVWDDPGSRKHHPFIKYRPLIMRSYFLVIFVHLIKRCVGCQTIHRL